MTFNYVQHLSATKDMACRWIRQGRITSLVRSGRWQRCV